MCKRHQIGTVTSIDASRFDKATAYVTFDLHQVDDRGTYIFKTDDYGVSWTRITNGVPESQLGYAAIIREDLVRQGLLYAGTENALYVSFDDGEQWQKFDNGLPPAPYRWIALQENYGDLVAGTYGRGFWIALLTISNVRHQRFFIGLSRKVCKRGGS